MAATSSTSSTFPAATKQGGVRTLSGSVAHAAFYRRISFACVHHGLLLLTLLIRHRQRAAIGRNQLDLHFVKFPVVCAGRRRVRNAVLIAQIRYDVMENPWNLAVKLWK